MSEFIPCTCDCPKHGDRYEVEAERDRLREALERIAAQHGWCTEVQTHVLARRALGGTSDE